MDKCDKYLERRPTKTFKINSLKSKYWWLSVDFTTNSDYLYDLVYDLEEESYDICEHCWSPWTIRDDLRRVSTLCDKCYKKDLKKKIK